MVACRIVNELPKELKLIDGNKMTIKIRLRIGLSTGKLKFTAVGVTSVHYSNIVFTPCSYKQVK